MKNKIKQKHGTKLNPCEKTKYLEFKPKKKKKIKTIRQTK